MKNENQWLAAFLLDHIGDREHPMKRPKNPSVDRVLRDMIAKTVTERKAFIINSGDGYYMPSIEDAPSVREYIGKERARAKAITERADAIEAMLNEMIKKHSPKGALRKPLIL